MDVVEVVANVLEWMYKMIPVGVLILTVFLVACAIHHFVVENRGMPWEKEEKKAEAKARKQTEKERREFWAGKRA